ncbi:MAG: hypothetical protein KDB07_08840 [Planctomycetes bacterium]|nr:hypothetical protein [Planctomycetota bacterium]
MKHLSKSAALIDRQCGANSLYQNAPESTNVRPENQANTHSRFQTWAEVLICAALVLLSSWLIEDGGWNYVCVAIAALCTRLCFASKRELDTPKLVLLGPGIGRIAFYVFLHPDQLRSSLVGIAFIDFLLVTLLALLGIAWAIFLRAIYSHRGGLYRLLQAKKQPQQAALPAENSLSRPSLVD